MATPPPEPDLRGIEGVERAAWLACFDAAPAESAAAFGLRAAAGDGCWLLAARQVPLAKWNRVVGLGIDGPATRAQLDAAIEWSRRHANPGFAVQLAPGAEPRELADWLAGRGFRPDGNGWAKLWRDARPVVAPPTVAGLAVRPIGPGEAEPFGAICSAVFDYPPGTEAWIAAAAGHPQVRAYLAFDGATPIGTGLMFVDRGWAWLGFGGVLPAYRGRGAQTALLARRLADGVAAGVRGFTTETSYPLPGQEQDHGSYRNALRAGFALAYVRPNYGLPA